MISVDEALQRILAAVPQPGHETIELADASGRVLAQDVLATHNQPPFDSSAMDGYAVRASEVSAGSALKMAGTSQAGARFIGMMERGQCVRIFTGAPLPIGADAVVMQEDAEAKGNRISFANSAEPGQNVRRQGFDFQRGTQLLKAGMVLSPGMLSLVAAANIPQVTVTRRPRIAIAATGDELVPPGTPLWTDQIVASNSYGLRALVAPHSAGILDLGIIPDDRKRLDDALLSAFDAGVDVLVTTGGASVGERDFVQDVLRDLGVKLDFWKLLMRPGKPLMFGTRGKTLIFGLPGNPVSALVTANVILLPAIRAMLGMTNPLGPRLRLPLADALPANGPRRHFLRGQLTTDDGALAIRPIRQTDSAHISSLAAANALIVQAENSPGSGPGDLVEVVPLGGQWPL